MAIWIFVLTLYNIIYLIIIMFISKWWSLLILIVILTNIKIILVVFRKINLTYIILFWFPCIEIFFLELLHLKKLLVHQLIYFFRTDSFIFLYFIFLDLLNRSSINLFLISLFYITINIQKFKLLLLVRYIWLFALHTVHFK